MRRRIVRPLTFFAKVTNSSRMLRLLQEDRPADLRATADDSYDADPQAWIARNADTVRQAFVRRSRHVLTCSDPREAPFGTIALPGLGIMHAEESLERIRGVHKHQPVDIVRSHVICRACQAFARRERIAPEFADEAGMAFGESVADNLGAEYEHSTRFKPHFTGPVNNLYVDTTLCLGDPQEGGLPPGFKLSQLPLNSWTERWLDGVAPDETWRHTLLLLDAVERDIPEGSERAPFNVVLFRDMESWDDSETLAIRMRTLRDFKHRPWQRYFEVKAPKRHKMRQEDRQ